MLPDYDPRTAVRDHWFGHTARNVLKTHRQSTQVVVLVPGPRPFDRISRHQENTHLSTARTRARVVSANSTETDGSMPVSNLWQIFSDALWYLAVNCRRQVS